eukprot:COSAG05_NODE_3009_length_2418_cov_1.500216_2_plen_114_part_00
MPRLNKFNALAYVCPVALMHVLLNNIMHIMHMQGARRRQHRRRSAQRAAHPRHRHVISLALRSRLAAGGVERGGPCARARSGAAEGSRRACWRGARAGADFGAWNAARAAGEQ